MALGVQVRVAGIAAPQRSALTGTAGNPGDSNRYVTDADSRNTNRRATTLFPIIGNDDLVQASGPMNILMKEARFFKRGPLMPMPRIEVYMEAWADNPSAGAEISFFMDSEASPRMLASIPDVSPSVFEGAFPIDDLSEGIHTLKIFGKTNSGFKVNQQLVEIYQRMA